MISSFSYRSRPRIHLWLRRQSRPFSFSCLSPSSQLAQQSDPLYNSRRQDADPALTSRQPAPSD